MLSLRSAAPSLAKSILSATGGSDELVGNPSRDKSLYCTWGSWKLAGVTPAHIPIGTAVCMRLVGHPSRICLIGFIIAFVNAQILSLVPFVQYSVWPSHAATGRSVAVVSYWDWIVKRFLNQCHLYSLTPRAPPLLLHASVSL